MSPQATRRVLDLAEEGYTTEQISLATGESPHDIARAINSGDTNLTQEERRGHGRKSRKPRSMCKQCGVLVVKPCLLCRQNRIGAVASAEEGEGPLPGDPTPEEVLAMAAHLRSLRPPVNQTTRREPGIRQYFISDLDWGR